MADLLSWDIYEITAQSPIIGMYVRGRLRKFATEKGFNLLCENAGNIENCVRFALLTKESSSVITGYIRQIIPDAKVVLVRQGIVNPVLSKLGINEPDRYTL